MEQVRPAASRAAHLQMAKSSIAEMQMQLQQSKLNEHRRFEDMWSITVPKVLAPAHPLNRSDW